ncbi:Crp/Fnr family transcriptional regulator [Aquimarina aquimarini]|uniref:Crp/Fnr family transcriptional regulator n=1 Tax=Aquimarina aquimarini TaxID=1191734 RepID=UPI001F219207|nr:Crp/Fnr family transcriptional regulator [Aquimarina aquimarini]
MNLNNLSEIMPPDLTAEILGLITEEKYKRNHILHKEGTTCNYIYIVKKGIARTFYHKEEKDISVHFALEGDVTTAIDSLISREKSRYGIELLEDCELKVISYGELQALLSKYPQYEEYIRAIILHSYVQLANRVEEFLFFNAKERYDNLIKEKPMLLQRVNLGHISSYLGITQETLSRIRKSV